MRGKFDSTRQPIGEIDGAAGSTSVQSSNDMIWILFDACVEKRMAKAARTRNRMVVGETARRERERERERGKRNTSVSQGLFTDFSCFVVPVKSACTYGRVGEVIVFLCPSISFR